MKTKRHLKDLLKQSLPKVTVIVVNWNGARVLKRCVDSLLRQTFKPYEIIVLDNASTDDSIESVRYSYGIRLIERDQNTGFARGNNLAIKSAASDSDWIALLNPDAFADPRWLETLIRAADANPEFKVFGSKLLKANNPEILDGTGDAYHISGLAWRIGHGLPAPEPSQEQAIEIFSPCAAAAMYSTRSLQDVGGFDEDFFCYMEDVDIGFRLRLAGYRCLYVPQSIALHIGSDTSGGQHSDFALYHGHRNLVWTFFKNMPSKLFWPLLPLHAILNLVTLAWFALRGQGRTIFRAKTDALYQLPKMWKKRAVIQGSRSASIADIWRILSKRVGKKAGT